MKKIISIILGIMLMLSMSVTSFAYDYVKEPTTSKVEDVKIPTVQVIVEYDKDNSSAEAISFNNKDYVKEDANPLTAPTGRIFKFKVTLKNDASRIIVAADVLSDFDIKFYDKESGKNLDLYDGKDAGFKQNLSNSAIDPRENKEDPILSRTFDYTAYVITDKPVKIEITSNGETTGLIGPSTGANWKFIVVDDDQFVEEDTSTSTDTSTPSEPEVTEKEETSTSTTQPSTNAPEVTNPVTPETEEPSKAPADVDDTIPDTGATVPFAAIGTLVTSAITALVAKKKKEN